MSKEISQRVHDLAGIIGNSMTVGDQGVVEVPEDLYEQTLEGTEITMEQVKAFQAHNADLYSATGLALGRKGIDAFQADKSLESASVQFNVGKDVISQTFQRSRAVPDGKGGMKNRAGVLTGGYASYCSKARGQFPAVKTHLSELMEDVASAS